MAMGSLLLFKQTEFLSQPENKCFMIFSPKSFNSFCLGGFYLKVRLRKFRALTKYFPYPLSKFRRFFSSWY